MIPVVNCHKEYIDEIIKISGDNAIATSRRVAVTDGVFVGISSGAAVAAALQVVTLYYPFLIIQSPSLIHICICFAYTNVARQSPRECR